MAHIKKLVMQGFKSFAKKTEIPFDNSINVIIGPNGSGKSNISDAICFALGRLSAKSMRAEKAKNLIFMGSKYIKPAKEAYVELVFDNKDRAFNIDNDEVKLKRYVRMKSASVYKINDETKTRTEVIETLAQAGIDPYGYNMILQGQIQSIVKMHGEERRKIIGEVAGISVYEWRKDKSLKELNKTEERLKEISTILRERTAQLNNLERERSQAKRFKELETTVKRCKATITRKRLDEKQKEIQQISKAIEKKLDEKGKGQAKTDSLQDQIDEFSKTILEVNKKIKDATGLEQSQLRDEITNFKADLEGRRVRKEGQENRKEELDTRIEQMQMSIPEIEKEIAHLREESPLIAKKSEQLKQKKESLAELEKERKSLHSTKMQLESTRERIIDKKAQLARVNLDSEQLLEQLEKTIPQLNTKNEQEAQDSIVSFNKYLEEERKNHGDLHLAEIEHQKTISLSSFNIQTNNEIKSKVDELDLCPLCQTNISKDHIEHVFQDCNNKIQRAEANHKEASTLLEQTLQNRESVITKISELENQIKSCEKELHTHASLTEKQNQIKSATSYSSTLKTELADLEKKRVSLENKGSNLSEIEVRYKDALLEIEEVSSRTEQNIDDTLMFKERDLEKIRNIIESTKEDLNEIATSIEELAEDIETTESSLEEKENQESVLNARFKEMFAKRDSTQTGIQESQVKLSEMQSEVRQTEEQINYLKVGKAKIDGEREVIGMDLQEYLGTELLQGSLQHLEERLKKSQETLNGIGSINMRALEVYDEIKKEFDNVKEKTDIIIKEKDEIAKIIEEIDKKKKKTFMRTFKAVNELFSKNFAKLYSKGTAYLEIEKRDDMSEGGVDIVVKMAKGKYFDIHSLSGGEQTLVALALLFAIQEHKPYHFYILDEIDAALDKRNSERLAALLNNYTKTGQYIIVTHNDAIILDSKLLYGVSMHEGVSKILSLKLD